MTPRRRDTETGGNSGVKSLNLFLFQQIKQLLRLGIGDDKFDLYRQSSGQLEKMILMQLMMAAKSRHRPKRRTAANTHAIGLLQQPFPQQSPAMPLVFPQVKSKK